MNGFEFLDGALGEMVSVGPDQTVLLYSFGNGQVLPRRIFSPMYIIS